jgi:hypothetical protein
VKRVMKKRRGEGKEYLRSQFEKTTYTVVSII